jgi:hypothetical protein
MCAPTITEGKKEAVKTYIEQTKLLVTLASAFVLAPAGLVAVFKDRVAVGLSNTQLTLFIIADVLFIASVLLGYVVLGTIAGYQHLDKFDVYRPATMRSSLFQIGTYLLGLAMFIFFAFELVSSTPVAGPRYDGLG